MNTQTITSGGELTRLATSWRDAQAAETAARETLAAAAREAHAQGMSAYRIAKITGAASDTVAKWLRA